jgi:histidine ammonia-lyase/phenylalanine ammonia-lyase
MSPKTRAAHELIRGRVPFLNGDRRMEEDIKRVAELIGSGDLEEAVLTG